MTEGIILTDAELVELNKKMDKKASEVDLSSLQAKVNNKVSSNTVKNIAIIENGASTSSIPANTLIFEKE